MIKSENFYTTESANRMIKKLQDEGKQFTVEKGLDFGDVCEGMTIECTCIYWEE